LFSGVGGAALGFQRAGFRSVGAFDSDALACKAFEYLTGDTPTRADLSTMSPEEMRQACLDRPDVVFLSPPCKGHSGCLPQAMADSERYQEMNALSLRGIFLAVEAWKTPPPLIVMENVPRITSRGRHWLDQVKGLLEGYDYATRETVHDAGELGGLGQRRKRFLLVARHTKQVPAFMRVPPKKPLRGVGEILGLLPVPVPGSTDGGPMHKLPRLSPKNWVRLALIPAGGDWRDLPSSVAIVAGPHRHYGGLGVNAWDDPSKTVVGAADPKNKPVSVQDPRLGPRAARQNGGFGVNEWKDPSHAVIAEGSVRNTWSSVSDPRIEGSPHRHNGKYGVESWDDPAHAVIGQARTGKGWAGVSDPRVNTAGPSAHNGRLGVEDWDAPSHTITGRLDARTRWGSVNDPRLMCSPRAGVYGVGDWSEPAGAVIGSASHDNGRHSVADPRVTCERREGSLGVTGWDEPSTSVIANGRIHNGPWQVADPRLDHEPRRGSYGVTGWAEATHCVRGVQKIQNGEASVADPRVPEIVGPYFDIEDNRPRYLVIVAADGTWHRPMTTLELAALQNFPVQHRGGWLLLPGNDAERRELIGNAVPPAAAEAIALACLEVLAGAGTFRLSSEPIWVGPGERLIEA
jgi:site-specific DNA-cytosine methylase